MFANLAGTYVVINPIIAGLTPCRATGLIVGLSKKIKEV